MGLTAMRSHQGICPSLRAWTIASVRLGKTLSSVIHQEVRRVIMWTRYTFLLTVVEFLEQVLGEQVVTDFAVASPEPNMILVE